MPIGTWGLIRTYPVGLDDKGKPQRVRALAKYRDFDGVVRLVEASGKTATAATQNLRRRLQNRTSAGLHGDLTAMTRFRTASDVWLERVDALVADGRRSPGTVDTYRRQLKNHVQPALGEVRLGELTTPLVGKVFSKIKSDISSATAKSCRSVISGVLSLAVRYGAIPVNPVREIERIESKPKRPPRALSADELVQLLRQLQDDQQAKERGSTGLRLLHAGHRCTDW